MPVEISDIQRRVAHIAIDPATLRNQGAPGVHHIARDFLSKLNLEDLQTLQPSDFSTWLDTQTEALRNGFPEEAKNFGTARKALNIFLFESLYNRELFEVYQLGRHAAEFEVPLDAQISTFIYDRMREKQRRLPRMDSIRWLLPDTNQQYQAAAAEIAEERKIYRCELDFIWGREGG